MPYPNQSPLPFPKNPRERKPYGKARGETLDTLNTASAQVVLERIESYGGEDSAMVRWARMVMERRGKGC